jgi:hypothetical protein
MGGGGEGEESKDLGRGSLAISSGCLEVNLLAVHNNVYN